jgi:hypothetical protein
MLPPHPSRNGADSRERVCTVRTYWLSGRVRLGPAWAYMAVNAQDIMIGDACSELRHNLDVTYPISNGIVKNWDDMHHVWAVSRRASPLRRRAHQRVVCVVGRAGWICV